MDSEDSPGLLKSILGIFAQKQPGRLPPTSVKAQALDAWMRADAYLQHETNNFDEIEPEQVERTLRTFENLVQYDSDQEPDSVSSVIPSISCRHGRLTEGCGAELTPQFAVPKAPGASSHEPAS
jgi:hypothetical protein